MPPPGPDAANTLPPTATDSRGAGEGDAFSLGGLVAGRFRIERVLAEGGMGVVYLATDEKLNQPRALKVAKQGFAARLPPEARSALTITHPNVCRVFEIHTCDTPDGEVDFLTMEFIEGGSLARRLRADGRFPEPEARRLALQICEGVGAAHARGLLHLDLKPDNVLLAAEPDGSARAVVTDFGLARGRDQDSAPRRVEGTRGYMAPELLEGAPATVATDIYALGVVLHELIAGRRPAAAEGLDPKLPARWRNVVGRCLSADPEARFASVAEVAEALEGRASRRRAAGAFAAAIIVLAVALYSRLSPVEPPARLAVLAIEAAGAAPETASVVRAISYDLSNRLLRLKTGARRFIVIPPEMTRGMDANAVKERVGATHLLRASVAARGDRLRVHGAVLDASTQVVTREFLADAAPGEVANRLAVLVAAAFNLPRQAGREEVSAEAYPDYAAGVAHLKGVPSSYQDAIKALEEAAAIDPDSPLPAAAIAEACYMGWQQTLLERGRAELARATALSPDSFAVHLAAGKLELAASSFTAAALEFQRAIELDGASAEAWRGMARSYEGLDDKKTAGQAYLKAIETQPDYFAPLADFADFQRRMGNYGEAEKLWLRTLRLAPQSAAQHSNLGGLYADMGRWEDAERRLKRAIELDPEGRLAYNNLASLYQYRGRDAEAAQLLERARTLGPESSIMALNLGDCYRRVGNSAKAAEAYRRGRNVAEQALLADPRNAANRAFVAYFALRLGERDVAERELVQAMGFGPNDRTVIRRAVLCFEAMGHRERALAALQSASPDLRRELNRQPDLVSLQSDPRFQALLPP